MAFVLDVNLRVQQVLGLEKVKAQMTGATGAGVGTGTSKPIPPPVKEKDVKNVKNLGKAAVVTGAN
ncbi:hypothetical protein LCGC14_1605570, partial [marine sediment metagenome]